MRHGWRATGAALALATLATTAACGSSPEEEAAASSSAAAAAAATAAPGSYGSPVDPSLPNPSGVATDSPAPTASASAASATVVVTYSGWTDADAAVEFGAYVAGLAESGGTCTLTLTSGSRSARAQVSGEPDAASTSCPGMAVPGDELASGTWTAVVSYESPSTSGESDPVEVVVP